MSDDANGSNWEFMIILTLNQFNSLVSAVTGTQDNLKWMAEQDKCHKDNAETKYAVECKSALRRSDVIEGAHLIGTVIPSCSVYLAFITPCLSWCPMSTGYFGLFNRLNQIFISIAKRVLITLVWLDDEPIIYSFIRSAEWRWSE